MKILYVNTFDPTTEQHGGAAVTRAEMRALASLADVSPLFGCSLPSRQDQLSYIRLAAEVISGSSLKVASYRVLHRPAKFYKEFDLIWCNHDFSAYDHKTFGTLGIPYIVRKHNAEHRLMQPRTLLRRLERERIASFENRIASTAAATLHISSSEFEADAISSHKVWLPPLLDEASRFAGLSPSYEWRTRPIDLLCVSNFNWPPNHEGIAWFLSNVLGALPQSCTLHLVGAGSERYQQENRVVGHGFVEDLSAFLNSAKVFVAPVLSGAGVKIKNVTALAAGVPLLTTSCGIDGIQAVDASPLACIADGADQFIQSAVRLLGDEYACAVMSSRSSTWAKKHVPTPHTWCALAQQAINHAMPSKERGNSW